MAYVLGFFAADGSMYVNRRGSHYIAFYSNDKELIVKIRNVLNSNHKICKRISSGDSVYRYILQIGSKSMFKDLERLGFLINKSKTVQFPNVPGEFLGDFVRGYFDGDGNILFKNYFRKDRGKYKNYFAIKFISGSRDFLTGLRARLKSDFGLGEGSLYEGSRSFVLSYATKNSKRLCAFMYNAVENNLFLERKYSIYKDFIDTTGP